MGYISKKVFSRLIWTFLMVPVVAVVYALLGVMDKFIFYGVGFVIGWSLSFLGITIWEYLKIKKVAEKANFSVEEAAWAYYSLGWNLSCVERDAAHLRQRLLERSRY